MLGPDGSVTRAGRLRHRPDHRRLPRLARSRRPDRPFLLLCHHKAAHRSWEPRRRHHLAVRRRRRSPSHRHSVTTWRGPRRVVRAMRMRMMDLDPYRPRRRPCRPASRSTRRSAGATSATSRIPAGRRVARRQRRTAARLPRRRGTRRSNTIVIYTSDQGLLPWRPRLVRQAADVRTVAGHAAAGPLPGARRGRLGLRRHRGRTSTSPRRSSSWPGSPCPTTSRAAASRRCSPGARRRTGRQSMYYRYWMHRRRGARCAGATTACGPGATS